MLRASQAGWVLCVATSDALLFVSKECWAGNGPAARQPADAASEKALGTPALLPPGTVISKSSLRQKKLIEIGHDCLLKKIRLPPTV